MNEEPQKQKSGGAAPYGYRRTESGFEPDPTEAPIRKLIYELFLTHKRKISVAKVLNEKGYRTRTGAKFSDSSIDRFLRDPIAKGHHKDNYEPVHGPKKYRTLKEKSEWRFEPITPLVDEIIWNQVNDLLISQKRKPPAKKPVSLFTGLLYCDCGAKMHHPHGRKKYFCSSCDNSIEVAIIDEIYCSKLTGFRIDRNPIKKLLQSKNQHRDQFSQLEILETQKQKIESEMDKLYDLYISGTIPKTRFSKKNTPLQDRMEKIETEISTLVADDEPGTQPPGSTLFDIWNNLSQPIQRHITESITTRITVSSNRIKIAFSLPPSLI